jgi:NADH-quinone oxidoreductase subunit L
MSRMADLGKRAPDAMWTMGIALATLAALPPFSGFFSKESVLRAAEYASGGHQAHVPAAVGWVVLAAALVTTVLTAAYATRLFLLAFRGQGAAEGEPHRIPAIMNIVLWVLAVPTIAFGMISLVPTIFDLPAWLDGTELTPTLITAVLSVGLSTVGVLATYGAWQASAARRRTPLGAVATATEEAEPALTEASALATHEQVYGDIAAAEDPADPGRLLLGPLFRPASHGFRLDALYTALFVRPVLGAANLVRFLDREVVETYVSAIAGAPRLLGAMVRRAQTGNVQTYLSVLLAGSVVLAVLVVVGA